ncbi:hypothetical protein BV505_10750 [Thermomonas haemolytica]|nr:hypothetical protein BV505_10750 [Thermomonas haemolytica]
MRRRRDGRRSRHRLRSAAGQGYRYDAQGRRVRSDVGGAQRRYSFYAQDGRLLWQRDEVAGTRSVNVYLSGSLVAEYRRPLSGTTASVGFLHTDPLGSPIAKTDAAGAVVETSEYEPYGLLLNRANDDRPGYTGHVQDSATGLTYMQQRYYDPMGVFLSVDPVSADTVTGWNFCRYCYAANNPYKFNDPDGRLVQALWGAAAGAGVEIFIQVAIQGKSFSQIDRSDVLVAAGVGALTGGVASASALLAARGTISVGTAVARTAATGFAAGATGSVVKDVANGKNPSATKATLEGAGAALGGAVGSKLALAPLARLEAMAAKGGLNPHVANASRSAIVGSDKSVVAAATSQSGERAGGALNAAAEIAKAKREKED